MLIGCLNFCSLPLDIDVGWFPYVWLFFVYLISLAFKCFVCMLVGKEPAIGSLADFHIP